jgi:phage/plasmid-like protein (TIGR03299 family)
LLAKLPGYIRTVGDDVSEKYLLLSNSHDGSGSVEVMFTPIRVVCANTLNVAIKSKLRSIKIRHTANLGQKVADAQKALGIMSQQFTIFEEISQKLATVQVTHRTLKDYVVSTGLIPAVTDEKDQSSRARNIMEQVSNLFERGKGAELDGARGTLWGAFNAVSEYTDHYRGPSLTNRTESLLYGSGANIKQTAFERALLLTKECDS